MALPPAGKTCPQAAGASAHPQKDRAVFSPAALPPAAGAVGRAFAVCAAFALVPGPCLGCGCFRPDDRPAGAGSFRAAGNSFPDARQYRHAGKTCRRGICAAAERGILVGQPEFSGRAAGTGSGRSQTGAGHCRRNAPRSAVKNCRHGGQHKPCQRDDAGGSRAGSGKRPGTHRHCPG